MLTAYLWLSSLDLQLGLSFAKAGADRVNTVKADKIRYFILVKFFQRKPPVSVM
jgi:hypothetical protein